MRLPGVRADVVAALLDVDGTLVDSGSSDAELAGAVAIYDDPLSLLEAMRIS